MKTTILTTELQYEHDVVLTRQRARQIAAGLGFDTQDQTRIATAISEIARNAFQYAGGGKVEFVLEKGTPAVFHVCIQDRGPGIAALERVLDGQYTSRTGMGLGIVGARRLMDQFEIDSEPGQGTIVTLSKRLPQRGRTVTAPDIAGLVRELVQQAPQNPFEEIQRQNQELLRAMEELRARQEELARLNQELEDTNRGVVALYAELDDKAESLQRANEIKTRFLSNLSHEFRTPLNAILSLSRLLLDRTDGELTEEQEKQVTYIRKSADDLYELVNDLLDLAKVAAGKVEVRPKAFDVTELFGALRGALRPLLSPERAVNLIFEDTKGIPTLHTDEGKVAQILRNLISNALKYTERGVVRVSAAVENGETIVFTVSDTGIGIAPEDQERIFDEFTQLENPLQKRVKGTGLGLPLSRRLAELLGGSLSVESVPGQGSTFRAVIPRSYAGVDVRLEVPAIAATTAEQTAALLIIDDDEISRYILRGMLSEAGYEVIEAAEGREGIRRASETHPQAIFLDLIMPGMDGFEVLEALRADAALQDTPVIIHTSKRLSREERERLSRDSTAILSKESLSRGAAQTRLKEILMKAGLASTVPKEETNHAG